MRYFRIQVLVIYLLAIKFPSNGAEGETSVADALTTVASSDSTRTVADTGMFAETFSPVADGASEGFANVGFAQLSHIKDNLTPAAKPTKTILSITNLGGMVPTYQPTQQPSGPPHVPTSSSPSVEPSTTPTFPTSQPTSQPSVDASYHPVVSEQYAYHNLTYACHPIHLHSTPNGVYSNKL